MRVDTQARKTLTINITPLVDVVFILLIFFMLASKFVSYQSIDIEISSNSHVPSFSDSEVNATKVYISERGYYEVNNNIYDSDGVMEELNYYKTIRSVFYYFSEPNSSVQSTVSLLDVFDKLNITNLVFQLNMIINEGKRAFGDKELGIICFINIVFYF
jgi:Biopolymer transport protein